MLDLNFLFKFRAFRTVIEGVAGSSLSCFYVNSCILRDKILLEGKFARAYLSVK